MTITATRGRPRRGGRLLESHRRVLAAMLNFYLNAGRMPSCTEVLTSLGIASRAVYHQARRRLLEEGYLREVSGQAGIELVGVHREARVAGTAEGRRLLAAAEGSCP